MAEIKLTNLAGAVTQLQSAFEGFVLGIFDGDGAMNDFLRTIVQGTSEVLNFFTSTEKVSDSMREQQTELYLQEAAIDRLDKVIGDVTTSEDDLIIAQKERVKIIKQMIEANPDLLAGIDAETIATAQLKDNLVEVNRALVKKLIIQEKEEEFQEQALRTKEYALTVMDQEKEIAIQIAKIREESAEDGFIINATDEEGVRIALRKLKAEGNLLWDQNARYGTLNGLINQQKINKALLNIEEQKGVDLLKVKNELLGDGAKKTEVTKTTAEVVTPKPKTDEDLAKEMLEVGETDEEKEIREKKEAIAKKAREKKEAIAKRARDKEKKDILDFKNGVIKDSENLEANSDIEKVELERKRHLAKLDALTLEGDEKLEQKKKVDAIYDQKVKALKDKADEDADAINLEKEVLDREIQLEKEFIEMQRLLENDKLTAKERIKLHQEYLDKKTEIEVLAAAGNKDDIDKINKKAKGAKEKIQTAEVKAEKEKLKAELDMNVNTALESFGIAQEVSVAKMIMNAPTAIGNSFATAADHYAPPISLAMGALGAAGVIVPIMKGLSDIKKTRFSAGGKSSKTTSGGAPPTSGAGPTAVSVADVENLSGSNASRMATDSSLNSRASSDAANGGMLSGAKGRIVFSENAYSNFQSQVDFREDKTTL
jgi:hypothetical protein